jgi:hypothetical protein
MRSRYPGIRDQERNYRQHSPSVDITQDALTLASDPCRAEAISISVDNRHVILHPGERPSMPLVQRS